MMPLHRCFAQRATSDTSRACPPISALVLFGVAVCSVPPLPAQTRDRARIAAAVDSLAAEALKGGQAAGLTVGVVRGRDTLVLKAYGKADLELDVPTPDRAVYQIGSITKQFTAAAIMQLMEQGKLSLDDEIMKYLPKYPLQGHRVTVRRLLDHTSGIAGYTELPEIGAIRVQVLPRDSLVSIFSSKPFDFAPGDAQLYNNSAFILLGLIIEKVSGLPYEEYVQRHLFARAEMPDSRYCSNSAVVPRRAHGYDFADGRLNLASYVNFRWPYAAGALCSTAGDLIAWNRALHGGRLLGAAAYRELVTPDALNDGTRLRYAKALRVDSILGHRTIGHDGGIDGYRSELVYFPDDTLTLVVLINTLGPVDPGRIARSIAAIILGDRSPPAMAFHGRAADYVGEYRGPGPRQQPSMKFAADTANGLTLSYNGSPLLPLSYSGGETFNFNQARFTFIRDGGRVTKVRVDIVGSYIVAIRSTASAQGSVPR